MEFSIEDTKAPKTLFDGKLICGIPVRFHDFVRLNKKFDLNFVEFHMSDRDMNIDPSTLYQGCKFGNIDFAIHASNSSTTDLHLICLQ